MRSILLLVCLLLPTFAKPTLWIIGDSTVRTQTAGQLGWGDPLVAEFDPAMIEVRNRAIGGRSSRTFLSEGRWDAILANLEEGDFVLMQFGHNDGGEMFSGNRPRASIKGNGDESESGTVEMTGQQEEVRSFGWYLRHYCRTAREKGATPIVASLIPRNRRGEDDRIARADRSYARWAREAAHDEGAYFIDFNAVLAGRYDELGEDAVDALFAEGDHTHTAPDGAAFNARVMAEQIRQLDGCQLGACLRDADCWLPRVFSDHMVLQREAPVPVWGRTRPDTPVVVSFAGNKASTTSADDGTWSVKLPPQPAGGPFRLEVEAAATRSFSDVMVGEVWLCSGQSNMSMTVAPSRLRPWAGVRDWEKEVAEGDVPGIRMFSAALTLREHPQPDVEGTWRVASPESVPEFSAVAWFFALDLHDRLEVPIGLVTCAFGGSKAEAWTSREKLASEPELAPLLKDFGGKQVHYRDHPQLLAEYGAARTEWIRSGRSTRAPAHPNPVFDKHNPCVLFNGMLHPVLGYGIRGAIWYQGESNVETREHYPAAKKALIEDWRQRWGIGDFPFHFVQLAGYHEPVEKPGESPWAEMREAQASALSLANTGMAVAHDIGEARDIHPRNKQDVGQRLARVAIVQTYGGEGLPGGPVAEGATLEGNRIRIHFSRVGDGLTAKGGTPRHFAIAGGDGRYFWAEAAIESDDVLVSHPEVPRPVEVRYAWADNPAAANLCNSAGLPTAPFRIQP